MAIGLTPIPSNALLPPAQAGEPDLRSRPAPPAAHIDHHPNGRRPSKLLEQPVLQGEFLERGRESAANGATSGGSSGDRGPRFTFTAARGHGHRPPPVPRRAVASYLANGGGGSGHLVDVFV